MIYITGDIHGDVYRFSDEVFPESKDMTREDYVIVSGDFGYWTDSNDLRWRLNWLDERPFTTLFVDGNHECFDRLYELPVETWKGGKVHRIADNIYHLMRGQIFEIEGLKFFTFGGAQSHDIYDGVLGADDLDLKEKMRELNSRNASYRINHVSWWKEEMPSQDEMNEGIANLYDHGNKVDFIVSHSPSTSIRAELGYGGSDSLTEYLEGIRSNIDYTVHFFGHMHIDINLKHQKAIGLYEQIIRIT